MNWKIPRGDMMKIDRKWVAEGEPEQESSEVVENDI